MLAEFATWLKATDVSQAMKGLWWFVPLSQSIHILAIAAVLATIAVLAARAFGLTYKSEALDTLCARLLPAFWIGSAVLVVTGLLQVIAEPVRSLTNPFFQAKLLMVIAIMVIVKKIGHVGYDPRGGGTVAASTKVTTLASMALLLAIIFCGRWIAYSALL